MAVVSMENFGQLTLFDNDTDTRAVPLKKGLSGQSVELGQKFANSLREDGYDDEADDVWQIISSDIEFQSERYCAWDKE